MFCSQLKEISPPLTISIFICYCYSVITFYFSGLQWIWGQPWKHQVGIGNACLVERRPLSNMALTLVHTLFFFYLMVLFFFSNCSANVLSFSIKAEWSCGGYGEALHQNLNTINLKYKRLICSPATHLGPLPTTPSDRLLIGGRAGISHCFIFSL